MCRFILMSSIERGGLYQVTAPTRPVLDSCKLCPLYGSASVAGLFCLPWTWHQALSYLDCSSLVPLVTKNPWTLLHDYTVLYKKQLLEPYILFPTKKILYQCSRQNQNRKNNRFSEIIYFYSENFILLVEIYIFLVEKCFFQCTF